MIRVTPARCPPPQFQWPLRRAPDRLALLAERSHALGRVVGVQRFHQGWEAHSRCVPDAQRLRAQHHLLDRAQRQWSALENFVHPALHRRVERTAGNDFVDQTVAAGLGGADLLTGEEHAHREPVRELPHKLEHAAVERDPAYAWFGESEARVLDRDHDVAPEDHFEAAAYSVAVHRRNHRHVQGAPDRQAAETVRALARPVPDARLARLLHAHVRADAEGALARPRQDHDPDVTVDLDPRPDVAQLFLGRGTQGIEYTRAIDRDTRHMIGELVTDLAHRADLVAVRSSIRSAEEPSSRRIFTVCSPTRGGGRPALAGVP